MNFHFPPSAAVRGYEIQGLPPSGICNHTSTSPGKNAEGPNCEGKFSVVFRGEGGKGSKVISYAEWICKRGFLNCISNDNGKEVFSAEICLLPSCGHHWVQLVSILINTGYALGYSEIQVNHILNFISTLLHPYQEILCPCMFVCTTI